MRRREVLTAGLGAVALAAPAIRRANAQTLKPLVIGGSVPLTGAAAETGLNVNNGYVTAATYLNEVLGGVEIADEKYKIELKLFDDASDPARLADLVHQQFQRGAIPRDQPDLCALLSEQRCSRAANTSRGAGDDNGGIAEVFGRWHLTITPARLLCSDGASVEDTGKRVLGPFRKRGGKRPWAGLANDPQRPALFQHLVAGVPVLRLRKADAGAGAAPAPVGHDDLRKPGGGPWQLRLRSRNSWSLLFSLCRRSACGWHGNRPAGRLINRPAGR